MSSRRDFTFVGIPSSLLTLALGQVALADSPAAHDSVRVSALVRTALFVRDLKRSLLFYGDTLGLQETYAEGSLEMPAARQLLGLSDTGRIRFKIVKAAGPNRGMIGLFELHDADVPEATNQASRANFGEGCLVFYCANLDVVVAAAKRLGLHIVSQPVQFRFRDAVGQREMTLRDPDGMLVNLIERSPDDPR